MSFTRSENVYLQIPNIFGNLYIKKLSIVSEFRSVYS